MCHHAIEKVFQLAAATFSKKAGPDSFTVNLEKLISLTNKLGGSDVGLDCCAALQKTSSNSPNNTQDSPRGSRDRCLLQPHICCANVMISSTSYTLPRTQLVLQVLCSTSTSSCNLHPSHRDA